MVQTRSATKNLPPILKGKIVKGKKSKINFAANPKLKKLVTEELRKQSKSKPKLSFGKIDQNLKRGKKNVKIHFVQSQARKGVTALYDLVEKSKIKTELFDEEQPIFLQITCVKVPQTPIRQVRFKLKHTLLNDGHEICLIVSDKGKRKDHESTTEYYENLLSDQGITNIKTIMPFNQFRAEYGMQYELKRKLLGLYDYFLVDSKVCGYVTHLLGSIFYESRKMPTVVKMDHRNLKKHFENSLKKTIMKIHAKGDSYAVQIGHTGMSQEHLFENIVGIVEDFQLLFPGGCTNIRALAIKTGRSFAIPIYLTLKNKKKVQVPVCKPKLPKSYKRVKGELSTFINASVLVSPDGDVVVTRKQKVKKIKKDKNVQPIKKKVKSVKTDENKRDIQKVFYNDVKDEESEMADVIKINLKKSNDDSDDEKEDVLIKAEEMYLNYYEHEQKTHKRNIKNEKKEKK